MAVFCIAAGHGANDPGATYGTRKEKDDNLRLALAVGNELTKRGHTVRQFRTNDSVNCSATACRTWLGQNKADFSIVFHRNAYKPNQATGCETWAFNADALSVKVATAINNAIVSATGYVNRGRKGNGASWLNSSVPCCEPEVGFLDNDSDNAKFENNFNKIVTNIVNTLEEHFGKGSSTPTPSAEFIATGTTTNYLNIRKTPVNGAVLTSMPTGSKCNIYSIDNGWAYLEYKGYKGYSSTDYMTIEYIKKEEPKVEPVKTEVKKLYRVRDKWTSYTKQIGAYESLDNAINRAKATKLNVYDWNGKEVWNYSKWEADNAPKVEPAPVIKEEPKVETPKVETPKTEEPKVEQSKEETPKTEETKPSENTSTESVNESIPNSVETTENTDSLDATVPILIKILKKVLSILKKLWSDKSD